MLFKYCIIGNCCIKWSL